MVRKTTVNEFPNLKTYGLKIVPTTGDGNCLFNSFSDQLYGNDSRHMEIRKNVVDQMRKNPNEYKPFIVIDGERRAPKRKANTYATSSPIDSSSPTTSKVDAAYEKHLHNMSKSGTFANHLEIRAFCDAYNVDARVFTPRNDHLQTSQTNVCTDVVRKTVYIARHDWEHFSSIRKIDGTFTGIPDIQLAPFSPELLSTPTTPSSSGSQSGCSSPSVTSSLASQIGSDDDEEGPIRASPKRQKLRHRRRYIIDDNEDNDDDVPVLLL